MKHLATLIVFCLCAGCMAVSQTSAPAPTLTIPVIGTVNFMPYSPGNPYNNVNVNTAIVVGALPNGDALSGQSLKFCMPYISRQTAPGYDNGGGPVMGATWVKQGTAYLTYQEGADLLITDANGNFVDVRFDAFGSNFSIMKTSQNQLEEVITANEAAWPYFSGTGPVSPTLQALAHQYVEIILPLQTNTTLNYKDLYSLGDGKNGKLANFTSYSVSVSGYIYAFPKAPQ